MPDEIHGEWRIKEIGPMDTGVSLNRRSVHIFARYLAICVSSVLPACGSTVTVPSTDASPPTVVMDVHVIDRSDTRTTTITLGPPQAIEIEPYDRFDFVVKGTDQQSGVRSVVVRGDTVSGCEDTQTNIGVRKTGSAQPLSNARAGAVGDSVPVTMYANKRLRIHDILHFRCGSGEKWTEVKATLWAEATNFAGVTALTAAIEIRVKPITLPLIPDALGPTP
jgi:hypothetical protein